MTLTEWLIFFLVIQVIHCLGTWKLYVKAGRKAWEAAVPVYNAVILTKIINRPWWWTILLFIPVINVIMFPVIWVETIRSFGKNSTTDTFLVILTLGFYIYYINYTQDVTYIQDRDLKPKTSTGEWVSSIVFAVVAATIVHTYFMQPYTIPTPSLERTLLVGDYLFVSKFHYGARTPMTAVSFPMVHDTIPVIKTKSYLSRPQYPYFRLPGFQDIKRNDIVVFSWPTDTVSKFYVQTDKNYYKPIDKKSNYVKRCVGLPGDTLSVVDGYVHINGKKNDLPDRAKLQFSYDVVSKGQGFNPRFLKERYKISEKIYRTGENTYVFLSISDEALEKFKKHPNVAKITRRIADKGVTDGSFPQHKNYDWNVDNFGPLYIPKAGTSTPITIENIPLYKRLIEVYEGSEIGIANKITTNGNQVLLNDEPITSYTFKQDYYWMMGDNRHDSLDARAFGFTPFNHVVGKPVFIWMSLDPSASGFNKIRWERLFTTVSGSGEPKSYLYFFLAALAIWIGYSQYRKRKKAA